MNERRFKDYQRSRKTAAEKARRIAAGAASREQSDAQTKPWEALGISRRTFYRNRKEMPEIGRGTNSCPPDTKYLQAPTEQCQGSDRPLQVPARQASESRSVDAGGHSPKSIPKAVHTGHAVPLPLPTDGVSQPDLLAEFQPLGSVANACLGGVMPPELALAVCAAQLAGLVTQETVARQIGVSRPQLANALQGRSGLNQSAAANLIWWLEAARSARPSYEEENGDPAQPSTLEGTMPFFSITPEFLSAFAQIVAAVAPIACAWISRDRRRSSARLCGGRDHDQS